MADRKLNIRDMRRTHTRDGLLEKNLPADPVKLLTVWIEQAVLAGVAEPNAMSLATVRKDTTPDVRMVLIKDVEEESVTFFTNYNSRKAEDLQHVPHAACCFWWPELERQIRLRGSVSRTSREESAAYFAGRPRESQIGAWASQQSRVIGSREQLEEEARKLERKYHDSAVPVPDHWGGFRIRLDEIEFWQGRPGRMHDRICYRRENGTWVHARLSP